MTNTMIQNATSAELGSFNAVKAEARRAGFEVVVIGSTCDLVARNGEKVVFFTAGRGIDGLTRDLRSFVRGVAWAQKRA